MAFDQSTRTRLQKFVSESRAILTEEFTRQLQSTYGMDPKTGDIADQQTLTFLDNQGRQTALLLRETLAHYLVTLQGKSQKQKTCQALDRIIREQAFTVLNRLGALRMAEARGFLIESISKGYSSKGFQLYKGLAGTALGKTEQTVTGDTYRQYLFSLFDEFSLDLAVLFDRYSIQGRLFPRESALLALLDQINHFEIEHLWAEDETIGWIYQYFNSQEERKKMRAESQAPRNSRELAVRNQFFTPRYVVEFLTDNTLGRIWYEMTQGKTSLVDTCRYLVRRPSENFLAKNEDAPDTDAEDSESLSQEELLKQPVYIPFRRLKDPREMRMIDPACGSMHFGLYAFDLFEKIYEEAWQWESEFGPEAFDRPEEMEPLQASYFSFDEFKKAIPKLIIEYNIHGVDIDPRAVQIAGLSLWQRAHRTWYQMKIKPHERPIIKKSNIVCAEPMPGDKGILKEFTSKLNPPVLGQLVETIFDKMELAGEAGTLLKIEEEIQAAIKTAKKEYEKSRQRLIPGFEPTAHRPLTTVHADFWETAEKQILDALEKYADQAESENGQKRLFAQDAAKGFAFIDLCRKRFDVVLMNPPFGSFSKQWASQARIYYPHSYNDILGAFIDGMLHRLNHRGVLGAITSRTCFYLTSFKAWRKKVVLEKSAVRAIADLGQGVMDDAMVEASAYVLENTIPTSSMAVFRAIADADRQDALQACLNAYQAELPEHRLFIASQQTFDLLPDSPFVYWINDDAISRLKTGTTFEPECGTVRQGLATGDDFRYVRAVWEVGYEDTLFCYYPSNGEPFCRFDDPIVQNYLRRRDKGFPQWAFHVKSGASQPWYSPITLKINWAIDGAELRNFKNEKGKLRSRPQNVSFYYRPGFSWTRRAVRLYPYVIPSNCIPSVSRYMAFPNHGLQSEALAVCASRIASAFLRFYAEFWQRPNFLVETVKALPWPKLPVEVKSHFESLIHSEVEKRRVAYQNHEPFHEFLLPCKIQDFSNGGHALNFDAEALLDMETEQMVADTFGFSEEQARAIERDLLEAISYQKFGGTHTEEDTSLDEETEGTDSEFVLDNSASAQEAANLSYLIGSVFGRWDIRYATGDRRPPELSDPFDPLPVCPPGMLQNDDGLPAGPEDIPQNYPLSISWPGILVDDEYHSQDIISRVHEAAEVIWKDEADSMEETVRDILGVKTLRAYFCKPANFFATHLNCYSKSRRQAPIYWPLQTSSGSYTLWIYYHRLSEQTLYTCVNNFVDLKLKAVTEDLNTFRSKSTRSSTEEKELARLTDLEAELKDFRDELLRLAKFWKPNLNDGVQITAAPLWKLFQHRQWQKKLKETWEKLEKGEYDWAHLACSIWPERVLKKCHADRSLAIAHDVEYDFWEEIEVPVIRRGKDTGETKLEWQPRQLSETQLRDLIRQIIETGQLSG